MVIMFTMFYRDCDRGNDNDNDSDSDSDSDTFYLIILPFGSVS